MTNHNECMAAVDRVVEPAAWKITVWPSYQILVAFGYLPISVTTGAGWQWGGWLSHRWYFLSSLAWAAGAQAAPSAGWVPWHAGAAVSLSSPTASRSLGKDKGIHTSFLESLRSSGSSLAMERKRFMWYLKCWTRIHSRHFLSSEVWVEGEKKEKKP